MLRKYATSFSICFCFATDGVFFVRRFSTKFSAFFPFKTGVFLMICAIRLIFDAKIQQSFAVVKISLAICSFRSPEAFYYWVLVGEMV